MYTNQLGAISINWNKSGVKIHKIIKAWYALGSHGQFDLTVYIKNL